MSYKIFNKRSILDAVDTYSLRGFCMLMIMVHHVLKLYEPWNHTAVSYRWGDIGTGVFFFISGWGLYYSMEKWQKRNGTIGYDYIWRNCKKLLIPFLLVFPFVELLYCSRHPDYAANGGGQIIRDLFTLSYPPYPALWFMKAIFLEYVVAMLAFAIFKNKLGRLIVITIFNMAYFIVGWKVCKWMPYLYATAPNFLLAMWIAAYRDKLTWFLEKKWLILLFGLLGYLWFLHHDGLPGPRLVKYSIFFSLLMVALGSVVDLSNRVFDYIGRNSLLFYLFHIALWGNLEAYFPAIPYRGYVILLCVVLGTFGVVVLYNWCDKRIKK